MVVEIKQTDTPEEVKRKLQAIKDEVSKEEEQRKAEIMKYFGCIKSDIDPLEWQKKMRDEWD